MADWSRRTWTLLIGGLMVVSGCINTLSTKWADKQSAEGSLGVYDSFACFSIKITNKSLTAEPLCMEQCDLAANTTHVHLFSHPFLQAAGMFIAELSCFAVYKLIQFGACACLVKPQQGRVSFSPVIFLVPACCEICAISMMYIGLTMTFASSFQMLRSAVIIFTGLVSLVVLGRKLKVHQWAGMAVVVIGLILVGLSDYLFYEYDAINAKTSKYRLEGDVIIIAAQIIVAFQMAMEETYIKKYNVHPLQAIGWQGIFGFFILMVLLIPFYYIPFSVNGLHPKRLEDAIDGLRQIGNSGTILAAILLNITSIGVFCFAGVSVTKRVNAVTRMVFDSERTLFIWLFSLAIGWQKFQWLQPVGFSVLVVGMVIYLLQDFRPAFTSVRDRFIGHVSVNPDEHEHLLVTSNQNDS